MHYTWQLITHGAQRKLKCEISHFGLFFDPSQNPSIQRCGFAYYEVDTKVSKHFLEK